MATYPLDNGPKKTHKKKKKSFNCTQVCSGTTQLRPIMVWGEHFQSYPGTAEGRATNKI